jgi:hypothetical protein
VRLDSLALPLDRVRTVVFATALRVPPLRSILLAKQRRIPALLGVHAGAALFLAVIAPTVLLVLGPLLLGVPHLLSDLRFLVLRPAFEPRARTLLLGGSALLVALRAAEALGLRGVSAAEPVLAGAWLIGACAVTSPGRRGARWGLALAGAFGFTGCAWQWPWATRLVLAHGHNLVALALWVWGFSRHPGRAAMLALTFLVAAVTLVASPVAWLGFEQGVRESFGLHSLAAADSLAPGVRDVPLALGIVSSFAFLQSLHYAVWLHAIPQEETRGDATLSFRMSLRQLAGELGGWGLALSALLVVALPIGAAVGSPRSAKDLYLSLSSFHAYLELAAVLTLFGSGARPSVMRRGACR